MTPLAGFVLGIIAGLINRSARRAALWVVPPWSAVLAVQTAWLASGHDNNPASAVEFPKVIGYAIVQAISLALAVGVATQMVAWRQRRPVDPSAGSGTRNNSTLSMWAATIVAGVLAVSIFFITRPAHPGHGGGNAPVYGIVGIALCLVTLVALAIAAHRKKVVPELSGR